MLGHEFGCRLFFLTRRFCQVAEGGIARVPLCYEQWHKAGKVNPGPLFLPRKHHGRGRSLTGRTSDFSTTLRKHRRPPDPATRGRNVLAAFPLRSRDAAVRIAEKGGSHPTCKGHNSPSRVAVAKPRQRPWCSVPPFHGGGGWATQELWLPPFC